VKIIPAIDLMDGQCVRLVKGNPAKKKIYSNNPRDIAKRYREQGAELIHLIDLDAALNIGQNIKVIEDIISLPIKAQIGGGIRTLNSVKTFFESGAFRIILGSIAVKKPSLLEEIIQSCGTKRIAVAIDERNNKVAVHGWKESSNLTYLNFARSLEDMGIETIIFTPINVDGTLKGPSIKKIRKLVSAVRISVIASGGIGSLTDLQILSGTGVDGVIVGTALYEEKFTFKEALEAIENAR
jgi:phosphoribosylformimino-5-aminoimidazole carboxamide ribotide isomerase